MLTIEILSCFGDQLANLGIKEFTKFQVSVFRSVFKGENLLVVAPPGAGKTEAAILPIFYKLFKEPINNQKGIKLLYITPLRALNRDMERRLVSLGEKVNLKVQVRHGDTSNALRRLQASHPPDVLITTPETLQVILVSRKMRKHLSCVKFVVVDEIHELFSSKRGVQLSLGLERLNRLVKGSFQRIGLSATVKNPYKLGVALMGTSRPFKVFIDKGKKKFSFTIDLFEDFNKDLPALLKEHIAHHNAVLVFVNTRELAERLSSSLQRKYPSLGVEVHHGSLSKEHRELVEKNFKEGKLKALICTSSLELGIDIGSVDSVVQVLSPRSVSRLVQRIGRSGHKFGKFLYGVSEGLILSNSMIDLLESLAIVKLMFKNELETGNHYAAPLDVLAHQIVGLTLEKQEISVKEIFEVISRSIFFKNFSTDNLLNVLFFLKKLGLLFFDGEKLRRAKKGLLFYFQHVSTIPAIRHFPVIDVSSNKVLGFVDEKFIGRIADGTTSFIIKAQPWKVVKVEEEKVLVEKWKWENNIIPSWIGEMLPVSFKVAQEVRSILSTLMNGSLTQKEEKNLIDLYLTDYSKQRIQQLIAEIRRENLHVPTNENISVKLFKNHILLYTFLGTKANETLKILLSYFLGQKLGFSIVAFSDQYGVLLKVPGLNINYIYEFLDGLNLKKLQANLFNASLLLNDFIWHVYQVSKRFGVTEENVTFLEFKKFYEKFLKIYKETPIFLEAYNEFLVGNMDLKIVKEFIKNFQEGKIQLHLIKEDEKMAFYPPLMNYKNFLSCTSHQIPLSLIIEEFKEKIKNKQVKLICVFCGKWLAVRRIKYIEKVKCPRCRSIFIGITDPNDELSFKVLKKHKLGLSLPQREKEVLKKLMDSADLVANFGLKAVIALSVFGVGARTAKKILSTRPLSEEDFFKELFTAEKTFIRTREFWKK